MAEIITQQAELFFISALYGVLLGIWYDFFRAIRKKISHKNRTVHLEDIIFCISAAAGLFLLFQIYNQGSVRFYVLFGLAAGAALYFFGLGIPVEKAMEFFVGAVVRLLRTAVSFLLFPAKIIVNSLLKTLKKIKRTVKIVRSSK